MGALYDKVAAFDRGIADRWKTRTREVMSHRLTVDDINAIFGPVFAGRGGLKKEHGQATIALLDLDHGGVGMTRDAVVRIRKLISDADYADRFNLAQLTTDADLVNVNHALGNDVIGKIMFKSPGTLISYAPTDYLTIRELISQKYISVFQARTGGMTLLSSLKGYYREKDDKLVLFEFVDPVLRDGFIVHEVTHAIQDWKDVKSKALVAETDAFIAQAIAVRTMTGLTPTDASEKVFDDAALIAIAGNGRPGNRQWEDAYSASIDVVKATYEEKPPLVHTEKQKESDIFARVLSHVEMMEQARQSAARSAEALRKSMEGIDLSKYVGKP